MSNGENNATRSLLVALVASGLSFLTGCTGEPSPAGKPSVAEDKGANPKQPRIPEKAPHGGVLVPLGQETVGQVEAQLEFVLDPQTGTLTAYVLDSAASKPLPIKQRDLQVAVTLKTVDSGENKDVQFESPFTLRLRAVGTGDVTEMSGQSDQLKGAHKFEGTMQTVMVGAMPFKNIRFKFPDGTEHQR
jgi:hypothetical protein